MGIVDDNPKVAFYAGRNYPGIIFHFGAVVVSEDINYAIPCLTWKDVLNEATERKEDIMKKINLK